jgi:hypothetical protein
MTKLIPSQGAFTDDVAEVMTEARQPVFVDNAVHHALLSVQDGDKHKVTIENRNNATYNVMSEREYELVEGEASIQLTHKRAPGHSSTSAPFYQDEVLSSTSKKPTILFSAENNADRLTMSTFETSALGVKANLNNMKGRSLSKIGFADTHVRLGDPIDVGLRTSDLAMRLGTDVTETLTSVNIGGLRSSTNTNALRRKHTTRFLAEDFYGTNLIDALRFVSRQDSNIVMLDRYANLLYSPFTFSTTQKMLYAQTRAGGESDNPITHSENRVTVRGVPIALNEIAQITVNDSERQQGKFDSDIQETVKPIFDATVKSKSSAKRVARQILKANAIYKGSMKSDGHIDAWELRPGDIVNYKNEKRLITEARHTLSNRQSSFKFLSLQKGIEGVLQDISSGMASSSYGDNPDVINQITEENMSLFNSIEIHSTVVVSVRAVESTKFLIGAAAGRAKIGKANGKTIGMEKMHTLRIRGDE